MKFMVINGPNLNILERRDQGLYGDFSLDEIKSYTEMKIAKLGNHQMEWFQSNCEGSLIDKIHSLMDSDYDALIINPGGLSHTSVSILDALRILSIPIIEVHITNIYKRESFRHTLLTAKAATIIMGGLGRETYLMAAAALIIPKH